MGTVGVAQAIAPRLVTPGRVVMRNAGSHCAILLNDDNRKTIARMHCNGLAKKYPGTFAGKQEERHLLPALTAIYQLAPLIEARLRELDETVA